MNLTLIVFLVWFLLVCVKFLGNIKQALNGNMDAYSLFVFTNNSKIITVLFTGILYLSPFGLAYLFRLSVVS